MKIDIDRWLEEDPDNINYDKDICLLDVAMKDGRKLGFRVDVENGFMNLPEENAQPLMLELLEDYLCDNLPTCMVHDLGKSSRIGTSRYVKKFNCDI